MIQLPGKTYAELAALVVREIFQAAFVVYFGLLVVDKLSSGFIAGALSLDLFFWLVLGTGALTAITSKASVGVSAPNPAVTLWISVGFGILAGAIVFSQLGSLEMWRVYLSLVVAVIVFVLSQLFHQIDFHD